MRFVVANWKCHKTETDLTDWFSAYGQQLQSKAFRKTVTTILCPAYPLLSKCKQLIEHHTLPIQLGVQDISPYEMGAYTGEVAAAMVADMASYALVGHSERRRYFGETSTMVASKVSEALEHGLVPIVCVDEPYLDEQLAALESSWLTRCIYAYEPLSSIGTGAPDTPDHAAAVAGRIHQLAGDVAVLYGGSVTETDFGYFLNKPQLAGGLVGGASLNAASLARLVAIASGDV